MWGSKDVALRALTLSGALLVASVQFPGSMAAQAPVQPAMRSDRLRSTVTPASTDLLRLVELSPADSLPGRPPTYRTEGAIIGGVVVGGTLLVLGILANDSESGSVNVPVVTLVGAAVGGVVGAMIGGGISRTPPNSSAAGSSSGAH